MLDQRWSHPQGPPRHIPSTSQWGEGAEGKNNIRKMECLLRFNIERMKYMAIMNYNHGFVP